MEIAVESACESSAPRIVNQDGRAKLSGLHHRFCLATILESMRGALDQEDVYCTLIVIVAALDKGVRLEDCPKTVLCSAAPEQFRSYRSR